MSIAFLCLTYNGMNPSLKSAKLPNVFMNTKESNNSNESNTSKQKIYSFPTKWGDPSLVDATLSLLKEALKENHSWFCLISHDAYPLKTYEEMCSFLESQTKSMFDLVKEDGLVYKTSQWWCLNRVDAECLVENEKMFKSYLQKVPFPKNAAWDELYFLSCLKHKNPVYTYTQCKPVYTEWLIDKVIQKHPVTFGKRLITDSFGDSFFVRKTTLAFDNTISLKKKLIIQVYGTESDSIFNEKDTDLVLISLVSNDKIPEPLLNNATRIYFSFYKYVQDTLKLVLNQVPTHLWTEVWLKDEKGNKTKYEPKKVAFLFLTISDHHQPEIWTDYLVKNDKFSIYCHPKINKIKTPWLSKCVIPKRVKTSWGHITAAYYRLLEESLKDPLNMKFMFLSESCIPLKTFDSFYQKVITDDVGLKTSYIKKMPISGYDRKERIETQKGYESYTFIKHYARMCLSRYDAEKLVDDTLKARKMRAFFNDMHVGDEFFLSGIQMEKVEDFEMTYDNWEDTKERARVIKQELDVLRQLPKSFLTDERIRRKEAEDSVVRNNPKTYSSITGEELDKAMNSVSFFWRKFVPGSLPWMSSLLHIEKRQTFKKPIVKSSNLKTQPNSKPKPRTRKPQPKPRTRTRKNEPVLGTSLKINSKTRNIPSNLKLN